jgi:hypothetical protein
VWALQRTDTPTATIRQERCQSDEDPQQKRKIQHETLYKGIEQSARLRQKGARFMEDGDGYGAERPMQTKFNVARRIASL